jgi:DNA-binding CsgD family transcriptional regulator
MRTEPRSWPAGLSRSEREVAKLLIRGYSYAEIASYRGVSRETVSAQIRGMLRKLGVDSASRLVAFLACYGEDSTL